MESHPLPLLPNPSSHTPLLQEEEGVGEGGGGGLREGGGDENITDL